MKYFVKLGVKATLFYDPKYNLKLSGNQVAEISQEVKASRKVSSALNGGHLVIISEQEFKELTGEKASVEQSSGNEVDYEVMYTEFVDKYNDEEDEAKLVESYTKDQLLGIANYLKIEKPGKTKNEIFDAIVEAIPEE